MQKKIATFPVPNVHIIGFQKCGTTAMAHFLSQHPDICMVEGKEAHVFDDPEYAAASDKTDFARQKYAKKLSHYAGEGYILDSTPITLFHPAFLKACVVFNPHAKFIVMIRDPVKRAFSHYNMTKDKGLESYSPFIAFLIEPWRMKGWRKALPLCPFAHAYRDHSYLTRGRYKSQFDLLYQLVDANQVLVVEQSVLASEHSKTLERVFQFLSLEPKNIPKEDVFTGQQKTSQNIAATLLAKLYFWLFS
ncbi:sulfotransferase family protein [Brumicola nitratireducens]|uniref:Sulfotransferase domain protein n=1 Tax=Glaciecola nitratireducens (strain JCM 12485 / KCTC 12276 / FR1064) TaxID=1085623 RepID=G4QIN8_GLANF|nr:sulfotransferase [Glaciecola nitratireducens]AEP31193.1 sulfotransferase domain protein [Glaciecola nitratireducens FR1064]